MLEDILAILVGLVVGILLNGSRSNLLAPLISRNFGLVLKLHAGQHLLVALLDVLDYCPDLVLELIFSRHEKFIITNVPSG